MHLLCIVVDVSSLMPDECVLTAAAATAAAAAAAAAAALVITAPAAELLQQAKASFHSSSSALSADLSSILAKELKHEKAVAEKSEVVAAVSGMG
jgi:Flp pilus assembly protein TadG